MKVFELTKKAYLRYITYPIDKIVNTLIWVFTPKSKIIVVNGFIKHRGDKIRPTNFGDDLNYVLVKALSRKRVVSYRYSYISWFKPDNYMCIGSIVDYLANSNSIIWGGGAIGFKNKKGIKPKCIYAVRGTKTRDYYLEMGINCPEIYGDPALLLPLIYNSSRSKRYKIGIIPHIVDLNNKFVSKFKKEMGKECVVIDLKNYRNWRDVVDCIKDCEIIASSSLHGLILSDAYNIPNVWIKLSNNIIGNDFKFYDYFSGCSRDDTIWIDYRNHEIKYDELLSSSKRWKPINYDKDKLLASCPFLSKDFITDI